MRILESIKNTWGGIVMEFPVVRRGLESMDSVYSYVVEGVKCRAILVVFTFDEELWNDNPDVIIDVIDMEILWRMDNLFQPPVILLVQYKDQDMFIRSSTVLALASKHSGIHKREDLTSLDRVYIPKENFELVMKHKVTEHA
jgi:hypothetical protein